MTQSSPATDPNRIFPIRRPVTTAMIFLTLVVFGWKSYQQLSLNLMPDISYPTLTVRTEFEGAAPEDVEKLLTRPLEETLSTVPGLVEISSTSSPGLSEVVLEFKWGTDMAAAQQDVRDRLDLFVTPREVTEKPVILRFDPSLDPVIRVALTGGDLSDLADPEMQKRRAEEQLTYLRDVAERYIKSDLEGGGELGIAQVQVKGGRAQEIQILVDSERLKSLGMSPANVVSALAQQNINLSGGRLKEGKTEYLVRTLNEFETIDEIRECVIPNPWGEHIRLRDIASVVQGQKDQETLVRINGVEAVELAIYKWGDANTVQVCHAVKDLLGIPRTRSATERFSEWLTRQMQQGPSGGGAVLQDVKADLATMIRSRLPAFSRITVISDQSAFILNSIQEVKNSAFLGGLLAFFVLYVFLRDWRSTLAIAVAMPISIISTFLPMYLQGITLNVMSLGGLALGIGMLVDNSIVVLESINRCLQEGDSPVAAAERGTREVRGAVADATFTTVVVFLPLAFVEGVAGQLFNDLALTVTYSVLASLLVALFLNPMLASRGMRSAEFLGGGGEVWALAAYREARRAGRGRAVSAGMVLAYYPFAYAAQWLLSAAKDSFEPVHATVRACMKSTGSVFRDMVLRAGLVWAALEAVLLSALFVVRVVLQAFVGIGVTCLFALALAGMAIFRAIRGLLSAVFRAPLRLFDLGFQAFQDGYAAFLRRALPFGPVVLVGMFFLAVHSGYTFARLGRELIPPLKQGEFGIRMEAPPGTRLEEAAQQAEIIEREAMNMPEIETVTMAVGQEKTKAGGERGENVAVFTCRLKDPGETARFQDELIETLRERLAGRTTNELTFTLPSLFSFKTAVEIQVRGDDLRELKRIGRDVLDAVKDIRGLKDAELTMREGYPEIIIELDRELLAAKGISPEQVAQKLRTEVQGDLATRFNRAGTKIDIRVRTDRRRLSSLRDLRSLSVREGTPPIPLEAVARITVQEGPSEIRRIGQRQTAVVAANVERRDLGAVARDIETRLAEVSKPRDYQFVLAGQNRELQTSYQSLYFAVMLAVFLVYVVMACQFESVTQPALVMFSMPMALIGVIYTLYVSGVSVSIMVFIGSIVLAGIVVNNAIVLVDYINQLRRRGMPKLEAVVLGARVRLRPILMTTLTTVLALLPMAFQRGEGAEIRQPMAITIIAGLASSTVLTLIIIPMVYNIFGGRDRT